MTSTDLALQYDGQMPMALEQLSKPMQRQARNQLERVIVQGCVTALKDQVRAELTERALLNTGSVSALADHIVSVVPSSAARCQHIADAYAVGAANMIARF